MTQLPRPCAMYMPYATLAAPARGFSKRCRNACQAGAALLIAGTLLGAAGSLHADITVGASIASGISAEQAQAIRQQIAATDSTDSAAESAESAEETPPRPAAPLHPGQRASARAAPCPGGNLAPPDERAEACTPRADSAADAPRRAAAPGIRLADSGWQATIAARVADRPGVDLAPPDHWRRYPQTGYRSPVYRSLNRPNFDLSERRIDDAVRQLGLLGVDQQAVLRLITLRTFRGENVAGRAWRPEATFDATRGPLLDRDAPGDRRTRRAALGDFFRHSHRLESDSTRRIHAGWSGDTRRGWQLRRFGPDPGRLQPVPPASMTPSPSPWELETGP